MDHCIFCYHCSYSTPISMSMVCNSLNLFILVSLLPVFSRWWWWWWWWWCVQKVSSYFSWKRDARLSREVGLLKHVPTIFILTGRSNSTASVDLSHLPKFQERTFHTTGFIYRSLESLRRQKWRCQNDKISLQNTDRVRWCLNFDVLMSICAEPHCTPLAYVVL